MKIRLKINGVLISLTLLLVAVFPGLFFRPQNAGSRDEALEILGLSLILLGQIFRTSARGYKSEHSQNGHSLIQHGPYRLVRNPMYLGILLIGLGIVLMLFQWWVSGIFLLAFVIRYILLTFQEEKKLSALFPKEYPDYCRRVPRLFPSLRALLEREISEYLPLRTAWIKKEIGTVLAVLSATLLLASWAGIRSRGAVLYLKESSSIFLVILFFTGLYVYLIRRTARRNINSV